VRHGHERAEQDLLQESRRLDEADDVIKLLGEERVLQEVGPALRVRLAVPGHPVEHGDHHLEPLQPRRVRTQLHYDVRLVVPGVPPVVRHASGDMQTFSEPRVLLAPVEPETHAPSDHREGLLDVRVDVLAGHRAAGTDIEVRDHQLPAGLLLAHADYHPLAGHRVLVYISRFAHNSSFFTFDHSGG
jgi:hypothetical protein